MFNTYNSRISKASYGLIKHLFEMKEYYLLQLNRGWNNQYNFISGHIEPEDQNSYQNTIIREVEEELHPLKYHQEFIVEPITPQPFKDVAYSLSAKTETEYTFYLFLVKFCVPPLKIAFLWNQKNSINRWFSEDELRNGVGKNGERITRFPVPKLIEFIPGGIKGLPDSFNL